jgi:hypothetical protein
VALPVYQDQPLVREDEEVLEQLVQFLDPLSGDEHPGEVPLYLCQI